MNEAHFLSSFIGALKEEIRFSVKLFKITTLSYAIQQDMALEKSIKAAQKKIKAMPKSCIGTGVSSSVNVQKVGGVTSYEPSPLRLRPRDYEYNKSNHMCFRCGEKYTQGHRCKMK